MDISCRLSKQTHALLRSTLCLSDDLIAVSTNPVSPQRDRRLGGERSQQLRIDRTIGSRERECPI